MHRAQYMLLADSAPVHTPQTLQRTTAAQPIALLLCSPLAPYTLARTLPAHMWGLVFGSPLVQAAVTAAATP